MYYVYGREGGREGGKRNTVTVHVHVICVYMYTCTCTSHEAESTCVVVDAPVYTYKLLKLQVHNYCSTCIHAHAQPLRLSYMYSRFSKFVPFLFLFPPFCLFM